MCNGAAGHKMACTCSVSFQSIFFFTCSIFFLSLQKSLREVQQILNSTEGNFHQLVALLNCRGLNKVTPTLSVTLHSYTGLITLIGLVLIINNNLCLSLAFFPLFQDYIDSLKGLCYDGMEGLLYLSLYSFLSALAFTAILCSLPGAWRSFPRWEKKLECVCV